MKPQNNKPKILDSEADIRLQKDRTGLVKIIRPWQGEGPRKGRIYSAWMTPKLAALFEKKQGVRVLAGKKQEHPEGIQK